MTLDDAAKAAGLKEYDIALPQLWVNAVRGATGFWCVGHFVWCYDVSRNFGEPVALTVEGKLLEAVYAPGGAGKVSLTQFH